MEQWLKGILAEHGAVSGTVHLLQGDDKEMTEALSLPAGVQKGNTRVMRGQGLAGLAWEQGKAITSSGFNEAGAAKPSSGNATVALPVLNPSGVVHAVIDLSFPDRRTFSEDDLKKLTASVMGMPAQ